jgi:hypothetical protein
MIGFLPEGQACEGGMGLVGKCTSEIGLASVSIASLVSSSILPIQCAGWVVYHAAFNGLALRLLVQSPKSKVGLVNSFDGRSRCDGSDCPLYNLDRRVAILLDA